MIKKQTVTSINRSARLFPGGGCGWGMERPHKSRLAVCSHSKEQPEYVTVPSHDRLQSVSLMREAEPHKCRLSKSLLDVDTAPLERR